MAGRTRNTMKNMMVMLVMQLVTVLASFVCRTFFVKLLATEYLGLSGLFTNIIAVLSLSELGFGSVIIVNLYKPLAENDQEQICKLMNFYRKAYTAVGLFIIACGLILAPFLDYLVKTDAEIPYLKGYFLLFILQSATSYFFAYKRSILTASQQEYICSAVSQTLGIVMNLLQILFLWITRLYISYLLVAIFTGLCNNIIISLIADKKFPFLKEGKKLQLDKSQTKNMFKNVSSMMLHKIGNTVISSTDNILISSILGVIYTGLYSNYLLIMNVITQIITIGLNAVSASVGDFNARKNETEKKELFDALQMMSSWIFGMSSICFVCLFQPTIGIWFGEKYLLDFSVVVVISVNFYINGLLRVPGTFSDLNGVYVKTKFKPVAMAIINLTTSIVCLKIWGLVGVFIGTLISYLLVGVWVDPYFVFKDVFKISSRRYFFGLVGQTIVLGIIGMVTYGIVGLIPFYVGKVAVCVLLVNALLLLCYGHTKSFKFIFQRIKGLFRHKKVS
ncbi:MAG: oligosaccharide flippase family protein [Clostridia bacterium]|nr:oligosaccharide flippase family protein [Clostridia bacterium]